MFFLHMQGSMYHSKREKRSWSNCRTGTLIACIRDHTQSSTDFLFCGKQSSWWVLVVLSFVESPIAILLTVSLISEQTMHKFVHEETPLTLVEILHVYLASCWLWTLCLPWLASYPGSSPCRKTGREPGRFDHVPCDMPCDVPCVVLIIGLLPTHSDSKYHPAL